MATTVTTRRNHYEVLGLAPSATMAEIGEAFGRELLLSRTRAFGTLADVSIAYEALRDPARRKAYDRKIGVNQPPPPVIMPTAVSFRSSARFLGAPPEPKADPLPPPSEAPTEEPRTASFIAASLRRPEPDAEADAGQAPPVRLRRPMPAISEADLEEQGFQWRRPAVAGAIVIGAVALIGAWAGIEAGKDAGDGQGTAVTVPVPGAKPRPAASVQPAAEARPRIAPTVAAAPLQRQRPAKHFAATAQAKAPQQAVASGPFEEIAAAGAVEAAPALSDAPVGSAEASLPLSHAAIARTIGRIGYPCGSVASTSQVLGNVFKVTCTSGDSYRAAPVHGRYRFKRLGSN
ncbi:MAG TPA: hypothetical protein VM145_06830 [Sphingomicrobium sp.]|nr:hypothetical protein [Sphingomicrobium sp.]